MSFSPYAEASRVISQVLNQRKGLKTVVYNTKGELTCTKATYAICCNVLQHKSTLDQVLKSTPSISQKVKNKGLLYVLLYELLLGPNQSIRGGGALKRLLVKQQDALRANLEQVQPNSSSTTKSTSNKTDSIATNIPRYVRVNTLVTTTAKVVKYLKEKKNVEAIYMDPHVPDLLVLEPTAHTRSMLQELVTTHQVILQDKSSCFSALCLIHGGFTTKGTKSKSLEYLDACAAPGNKTSHLASLVVSKQQASMSNHSHKIKIHAFDKSKDRFEMLQRRMKELVNDHRGGTNEALLECHNQDFLTVTQEAFPNVTAILLDPSCSGSGMMTTSNHYQSNKSNDPNFCNDRIESLSNFQSQALNHAATAFPKVDSIVYSTCSLYIQENEHVVAVFLSRHSDEWELIAPACLNTWKRRGMMLPEEEKADDEEEDSSPMTLTLDQAKCLIRVHPGKQDDTNGFFVACFQRIQPKKKSESEKDSSWSLPPLPKGIEYYTGQFKFQTVTAESTAGSDDDTSGKKNTKQTNGSTLVTSTKRMAAAGKRKEREQGEGGREEEESPSLEKNSKKRAKKLEWKKKQREKKLARLQKKQQQNGGDTQNDQQPDGQERS